MFDYVWLVPLLPLLGFGVLALLGKRLGSGAAGMLACATVVAAFALSAVAFVQFMGLQGAAVLQPTLGDWLTFGTLHIGANLQIDQLSLLWLLIITGIGALIHIYSIGYMHHDERFSAYMSYLNLFVFFMLTLVLGGNFLMMFAGWEGVGFCSYLLIGFWFTHEAYAKAARKAFVMNRIGDFGLLLGVFLIWREFHSFDYTTVFNAAMQHGGIGDPTITAIALLLFVGAMGKSAQIPLFTWLPDAMAGPTPVSALIHAATMVTAGIYMVVRCNVLYTMAPDAQQVVAIIGVATAVFAATIGIFQNDIKKVLAYSTVSQLGYMFLALGVGAYGSGVFHVTTHAFFKALLFLGAGSVIHAMGNEQDLRHMGGLRKALPITFATFLIGTIAISGIPPFAGFFSKDEILAKAYEHSPVLWALGWVASLMTAFYMFRLLFLAFYGDFRGTAHQKSHLHESPVSMTLPLMVLAGLSIVGGLIGLPELFAKDAHWLDHWLAPVLAGSTTMLAQHGQHAEHMGAGLELALMAASVAGALAMAFVASRRFINPNPAALAEPTAGLPKLVYHKYYIDELYHLLFVQPTLAAGRFYRDVVERRILDGAVEGTGWLTKVSGAGAQRAQTGNIAFYLAAMVMGIVAVFAISYLI